MNTCTRINYSFLLLLLVSLFSSCAKRDEPSPSANENQLIVSFSSAGIAIGSVDSMITYFTSGADTIRKKGVKIGAFYSVPFTGLPAGTYQALSKIYTSQLKTTADTAGSQYMFRYSTSIVTTSTTSLTGPTNKIYDQWSPSLYFYDKTYNITFAVAKTPGDPYFEINMPTTPAYKYFYIGRNVYTTSDSVKYVAKFANVVLKTADYKGFHVNQTAFSTFATTTISAYDAADVTFQLYNSSSDYKVLFTKAYKF
ncbi:hypothetical protein [Mucilaginibacter polytrichastri]|uniref:DUF4397 domain-containing protein n=1 Tax=Mucilaginibacter polytrichastri TaxID=1302689 RepID=A0A1Q5ZUS0_9SPHI|nr:hypothetical protein [Mucilaginibacter polytrichastri]OKS85506.1 hypothetical protein RG47T_0952 [Mucilaginibacter polytrichastri]SFS37612.1 hypothetical protein SAMN04487890_101148 [Mucilaginibacter polytrichastri]